VGKGHVYQGVFLGLIQEAQEAGLLRPDVDPLLATLSIMGSANWVYRWFRPKGEFTAGRIGAQFADFAIRGIASKRVLAKRDRQQVAST
jgi:hypothetical protein